MSQHYNPRPVQSLDRIRQESNSFKPGSLAYKVATWVATASLLGGCAADSKRMEMPKRDTNNAAQIYYDSIDLSKITSDEKVYISQWKKEHPDGKLNLEELTDVDRRVLDPFITSGVINPKKMNEQGIVVIYRVGQAIGAAAAATYK